MGAVPWIDYYGEKAESGYHYNKVQIALNQGTSISANLAAVHRYDAFYENGSLKPGAYTVTLYSKGFTPLKAEISVAAYEYMYASLTQKEYWANEGVYDSSPAGKGSEAYVPVRVATTDAAAFKAAYQTVANGGTVAGNSLEAEVDRTTNGLKTAVKNTDGSFSFTASRTGTGSRWKGTSQKKADTSKITLDVKSGQEAGKDGNLLHVDLKGDDIADLSANLYAVTWKYFGDTNPAENRKASASTTYGTNPADSDLATAGTISLNLADSLRAALPEGANGSGYWQLALKAFGYSDTTFNFSVSADASQTPSSEDPASSTDTTDNTDATDTTQETKKAAVITVKTTSKTLKAKNLAKKKQTFSIGASVDSNGKLSYKKVSGSSKVTINTKTGKITVKKKTSKGTYKIKVKIQAAATEGYEKASLTKTIKITVK